MIDAKALNEAMKKGEIQKEYIAVTEGVPKEKCGIIDAPIARAEGIRRAVSSEGKPAVTKYETKEQWESGALLHLTPLNGRTHQIRVHLAHMGTPIYGDWLYGGDNNGRVRLHCLKIGFRHPSKDENVIIEAPIPEDITLLIK